MKPNKFKPLKNLFFLLILSLVINTTLTAQVLQDQWQIDNARSNFNPEKLLINKMPQHYSIYNISIPAFSEKMERRSQEITIPNPNGEFEVFEIEPSNTVAAEVAHLYTIKTFKGFKKNNPSVKIACDISTGGFHAAVYEASKTYFVTPLLKNVNDKVVVYFNNDRQAEKIQCQLTKHTAHTPSAAPRSPTAKSTYRLAITASGEYSQQFGGASYDSTNVLNALASGVNIINPIYTRDLGIEFTLVSTEALIFPNPNTDPYTDLLDGNKLVMQCHTECTNALGSASFDIGHLVVWDDLGGLADFGSVCADEFKGLGYSGAIGLTTLWIDYVCHEVGHQLGADHTFASRECDTSEDGFRYEPGEGSSIMAYANVCGVDSAQYATVSDPFFHYASIFQIQDYLSTSVVCAVTDASGNANDPAPNAKSDITIPKQTPFILVGDATDADTVDLAGNLTYSWEQYDGAGSRVSGPPDCDSVGTPLFRYRPPVSDKFRSFPQYNFVLAGPGDTVTWEKLPCINQTLNFSLAVRDNNTTFGRVQHDQMVVTVANTGPFAVTAPNGGETLTGNASSTVTWSVNGTNAHCANVDILVSTDDGLTYNVVLDATANDGSENITVPNVATNAARVLVRCDVAGAFRSASTFYDVSNDSITITSVLPVELVRFYGENIGTDNQLHWETFSETDNEGFEVQRLSEGNQWKTLSFIEGLGNSEDQHFYKFLDESPHLGTNYYRLEQFDFDGQSTFSNIISIRNNTTKPEIRFYPNPASGKITFFDVLDSPKIEIFNAQGQLVLQSQLNESNNLDLSDLASGVYFMILNEKGIRTYHKLIKN